MTTLETTINPFDKKDGKEPEKIDEIIFEEDEEVKKAIDLYKKILKPTEELNDIFGSPVSIELPFLFIYDSLPSVEPTKMNYLLQKLVDIEPDNYLGEYITALILKAEGRYQTDGEIKFRGDINLDIKGKPLCGLGNMIAGDRYVIDHLSYLPESLLKLNVRGDLGRDTGMGAGHINFNIQGSCENVARKAEFCIFNVSGNIGSIFASKYCTFIMDDYFEVESRKDYMPEGCTFKTKNLDTYKRLKKDVPHQSIFRAKKRNKVRLMVEK